MSTMWGFDLDMAAVRLMRREGADWREIAVEKIDGADIEDRLRAMVERIDDDAPVELFLPRDQILYTDVEVSSDDAAVGEIEAAMDGRTPYGLADLDFDWEKTGPTTARVAAIALETLDEAAAFAEVRNLRVGGFSSLADPADFPRLPDFSGHAIFDDVPDDDDANPVRFATARETSRPSPQVASLSPVAPGSEASEPVVRVEESTPVMQVRAPTEPPLNPGAPIATASAAPRVRTDIAASTVSGNAASLTPPASVKIHRQGPSFLRTVAVLAAAFLVTVGVAALVWKLLPLGPGSTPIQPMTEAVTPDDGQSTLQPDATPAPTAPETQIAAAPPIPDAPQPVVGTELVMLAEPQAGKPPSITPLAPRPTGPVAPRFVSALRSGEGLPDYDPKAPGLPTPQKLASILTTSPFAGPDPAEDVAETTDSIYIASVERSDLSFDAIALPGFGSLRADAVPAPQSAPEADSEETSLASIDASSAVLEALREDAPSALSEPEVVETPAADDDVAPSLPAATTFAAALPDTAPSRRPSQFVEAIERLRFGGLTRGELEKRRPPPRPDSAQIAATQALEASPASDLAIGSSRLPQARPANFEAIVAAAVVQREAERLTATLDYQAPDTSSAIEAALEADAEPEPRPQDTPRLAIPSSASVSRQATIENAIRLNKVNLVGVYGTTSDRRALVRLPTGRYVKVKVGDRVDGGTVAQITDSELLYRKGNRTLSLSMPKG